MEDAFREIGQIVQTVIGLPFKQLHYHQVIFDTFGSTHMLPWTLNSQALLQDPTVHLDLIQIINIR